MGEILIGRRTEGQARLKELRAKLEPAADIAGDKACVYLTGSFARGEASRHSDLDLFIAGLERKDRRALSNLDEILLKAELIEATRGLGFPEFSGDGEYLTHYTVRALVDSLGKPNDDATNTFTARLLLLLESRPLLGEEVYVRAIDDVIAAYWRDFEDHKNAFVPAFLANDILRLWRTFCVNYEARTQTDPPERKAKRKLKNYKLKHSRLVTCYSALIYLLAVLEQRATVTPTDAKELVRLSPTERLEWLPAGGGMGSAKAKVERIIQLYEEFLKTTDASESELVAQFLNAERSRELMQSAGVLGNEAFELLQLFGTKNPLLRLIVV